MKSALLIFVALSSQTFAEIIAHVETDKGTISVELQYDKAPLAVANFITLSQGTRTSINPLTGAVRKVPYYVGEKFFRVLNDPTFKIAQTGSGTGTNSGGPGFTFKDEFDPSLTHQPYVLSMANSGPNTNGSQIFFTGSVGASGLNNVHTVFGIVSDPGSRTVIDAIHAAGNDGSSITSVTIERTDPAAMAFDEFAQSLPEVVEVPSSLKVIPGESVTLLPELPLDAGHELSIFQSTNLNSWTSLDSKFAGYDTAPLTSTVIDDASKAASFYMLARIISPDSPTPGSLSNRTLFVPIPNSTDTLTFNFDESGTGGSALYSPNPTPGTIDYLSYTPSGYGCSIILDASQLNALRFVMAIDGESGPDLTGRCSLSIWNGFSWNPAGSSTFTLTK